MTNARIPKLAAAWLAWLAVGCEKPMTGPISSTKEDLEQVYRLRDPALAGHQRAEAVVVGAEGITVLASANPDGEAEHTWLLRLDADGALIWERHHDPAHGAGRAIAVRSRGGFVIAGDVRRGAMAYQASLLAIDATGAATGSVALGPHGATGFYTVRVRGDDSIVAGGTARWKGWIVSTDPALQRPSEAPVEVDEVNGLAALPSGDVVAMASVEKSTTGFGLTRLVAVAPAADRAARWQIGIPSTGRGDPAALVATPDGGLLAVGTGAAADRDPAHVWLARADAAGKLAWERTLDGKPAAWRARAAAALPDGGFAVAGETAAPTGQRAPHVWRLAADGAVQWQRAYGGPDGEMVTGLAATGDGGLVMVGSTAGGPGKTNVWIVRLDPDGAVRWQRVFGAPAGGDPARS
jgi:hypothetical protein